MTNDTPPSRRASRVDLPLKGGGDERPRARGRINKSLTGEGVTNSQTAGGDDGRAGRLADNIVYFARVLRRAGLPVGPGAVLDALAALDCLRHSRNWSAADISPPPARERSASESSPGGGLKRTTPTPTLPLSGGGRTKAAVSTGSESAPAAAGLSTREDFYWTLHAVFVKRHEHSLVFDQAFRIFFQHRGYLEQLIALMSPVAPGGPAAAPPPAAVRVQEALFAGAKDRRAREQEDSEAVARLTASDQEVLRKKDFAQMSAAEIAAVRDAIKQLAFSFDRVSTRRLVPDRRGKRIDLRRTLRASLSAGGGLIDLRYLGPKTRPPPLVALLDISGSMGEYTRLFLHFLHAVTDARQRVHSFLFGTRLTNVTRALKTKDPDAALAVCSASVPDWAGGTRIATSLAAFNRLWARRVLAQGAVVLLITDGLERDRDDRLAFEIDRLQRSCRRLIWLNPLLRFAGFEPKAHGIRAMLPHVDEFRAIHNLDSMAALVRALSAPHRRSVSPGLSGGSKRAA